MLIFIEVFFHRLNALFFGFLEEIPYFFCFGFHGGGNLILWWGDRLLFCSFSSRRQIGTPSAFPGWVDRSVGCSGNQAMFFAYDGIRYASRCRWGTIPPCTTLSLGDSVLLRQKLLMYYLGCLGHLSVIEYYNSFHRILQISMVIAPLAGREYCFAWRSPSWSRVGWVLKLRGRISWWCLSTWSSPMISKGWFYWFHLPRCGTAGAYPHPSSDLLLCRVISTPTGNPSYRLRLWRGRLPCRNQMISTSISWWGVRSI